MAGGLDLCVRRVYVYLRVSGDHVDVRAAMVAGKHLSQRVLEAQALTSGNDGYYQCLAVEVTVCARAHSYSGTFPRYCAAISLSRASRSPMFALILALLHLFAIGNGYYR